MGVDGLEEEDGLYCNMRICIYDHHYNEFSALTVSFSSPEKLDDDHVSSILVLCRLSGFALLLLWSATATSSTPQLSSAQPCSPDLHFAPM